MAFDWHDGCAGKASKFMSSTSSMAVSREHRRAKTDRLDTAMLLRVFMGWPPRSYRELTSAPPSQGLEKWMCWTCQCWSAFDQTIVNAATPSTGVSPFFVIEPMRSPVTMAA